MTDYEDDRRITVLGGRYDPSQIMVWVQLPVAPPETVNFFAGGIPPGQPDTHVTAKVPLLALLASFEPVVRGLALWLSEHGESDRAVLYQAMAGWRCLECDEDDETVFVADTNFGEEHLHG